MSHQSYRDVFVSNNPALLQSGPSTDLAVGQLGIFVYDVKKDQTAVAAPDFRTTRAIQIIQGTPELPGNLLGAVANASDRSKPIKGKKILSWTGRKAERPQNEIVALGFDGVDTTKNITAKCEESKSVFLKLSGGPIDEIFHTEGKGYVRQYNVFAGCCDDCGDDCADVSAEKIADDLVNQINTDPILSLGSRTGNKLVRAKKVISDAAAQPDDTCTQWTLCICDNGDDTSLGLVQSQYPGVTVRRFSRVDSTSCYEQVLDNGASQPTAFSNEGMTLINDCGVCPSAQGYVTAPVGFAYEVQRVDAGDAAALTAVKADYGILPQQIQETAIRIKYQFGTSTYILVSETELTAVGTDTILFLGETRNTCILVTPTTTSWVQGDTLNKYNRTFTITLKDNVCGVSRLAELQAAYPDLVITQASNNSDNCTRKFQTVIPSECTPIDCPTDAPVWVAPDAFQGIEWTPVITAGTAANVGVVIESAFVDRTATECQFNFWRYDAEPIFIEVSQHSQDYNDRPTVCADEWPTTIIQQVKLPVGAGGRVREEENFFKGYRREYRDYCNPIVNELQNAVLQTDPNKFYDQYTLEFEFDFHQAWFSEKYTDTYRLEVFFPEGQGKAYEAAINSYISSIGIDLEPVYL
jgi:hypothetical protein